MARGCQTFVSPVPIQLSRLSRSHSSSSEPASCTCPRRPRRTLSDIRASRNPPTKDTRNDEANPTISWLLAALSQRSEKPASDSSGQSHGPLATSAAEEAVPGEDSNPSISSLLAALSQRGGLPASDNLAEACETPRDASKTEAHEETPEHSPVGACTNPIFSSLLPALPLKRASETGRDGTEDGSESCSNTSVEEHEVRQDGVRANVAWLLSVLAQRTASEESSVGDDEHDFEQPTASKQSTLPLTQDGKADGGMNAAVSWLLSAISQRIREQEETSGTKCEDDDTSPIVHQEEEPSENRLDTQERSDNERETDESLLAQKLESFTDEGRANNSETNPALTWILGLVSEKISSRLPAETAGIGQDSSPATVSATGLQDAHTKEAENQVLSWLTSKLSPDATKEEVENQTISWLVSVLSPAADNLTALQLQEILQRGSDAAARLSQKAMIATLKALNVEPFDNLEQARDPTLPRRPFDPVHALALAGYSFRAYLDPPRSSYRETFAAPVGGSQLSGLDHQVVYTDFVYPDTAVISRRAKGAFMLQVTNSDNLERQFVTAEINGALVLDLLKKRHCAVLCQSDPSSSRFTTCHDSEAGELVLNLFPNEQAYDEGKSPTDFASVSLAEIIKEGLESGVYVDGETYNMTFQKVSDEEKSMDFFHFSLLPSEMNLSFPFQYKVGGSEKRDGESVGSASISLRASFIPFPTDPEQNGMEEVSSMLATAEATSFRSIMSADDDARLESVLANDLLPGRMPDPDDWTRLAGVVRSLLERVDSDMRIERTSTVTENIPGALFIESLATDTEVWLFHDEANRDIVISFRGTEQVSWKDFFTDAQLFLQLWAPGEEIDLNVDVNRTVGLADFVPGVLPTSESPIAQDASAVHYGFLRAYMSIRDALQRGLEMLSSDMSEGYSFHFTGHSLGGALATIASADFQARHLFHNYGVSCVSYGAPKVGNVHFARTYNKLVPNSFRVVNDADLVSRMPRSVSGSSPLSRYQHSGRTVLVNNDGDYWIEGYQSESTLLDKMSSIDDPFRERYKNVVDLMAFEQKLWSELMSGRSVQHHMVRCPSLLGSPVSERQSGPNTNFFDCHPLVP